MDPSPTTPPPPAPPPRALAWTVVALVLGGGFLRLVRIERAEFWLDEACSALFASADGVGEVAAALARDVHPPLHALLLHVWGGAFGFGEGSLRAPSLLAGVALIGALPWVVRGAGGGGVAQLAAAMAMALSPWLLHYSTEARAYALLALLAPLLVGCLQAARQGGRPGRAWLAAAAATLAALSLSHHHGVLMAGVVAVAAFRAPPGTRRATALAGALGVLPWGAWAAWTLRDQAGHGGAWLADYWHGPIDAVGGTLAMCAGLTPFPSWLGELGAVTLAEPLATGVAVTLALPLLWLAAAPLGRPRTDAAAQAADAAPASADPAAFDATLLWAALLLPMAGAAAISMWRPIYLVGRYDLMVAPAFAALGALGLEHAVARAPQARRRVAAALALAAQAGAWLVLLAAYLDVPAPPPVHRAAAMRIAAAPAKDVVWVIGLPWAPLEVALRSQRAPHARLPFPRSLLAEPGQLQLRGASIAALRAEAEAMVASLPQPDAHADAVPAVWLVAAIGDGGTLVAPRLAQLLVEPLQAAGWRSGPPTVLPGLVVHHFVRDGATR